MNRKVNLNNKRKRLKLYYGLLITVVCIIGVSFAWFRLYLSQSEDNTLASRTCFSTTLTENTSKIALTDAFPISDEEGIKQTPFTFTLKNNCDSYVKVYITIKSTYRESTSTAYLKDNYLKVNISAKDKIDNTSVILGKQALSKLDDNDQGYIIVHTGLKASEAKSFDLRIWMDSATTLEQGLNKTWSGKIVVVTDASNTETTLGEAILANNEVQEPLTIPGLEVSAHTLDDSQASTYTVDDTTKSRYITYGTGFEESENGLKLTGLTITSDTYANSYSSLIGKYVASTLPTVSSTTADKIDSISKNSHLSSVLYIVNATEDNYTVKIISSTKGFTEALLASAEDDYGTSYYFRGAVKNNYVEFANKCWRIVRITGNGAIKLALHNNNSSGLSNPCSSVNNDKTAAFTGIKSVFNENYDDNTYVGFMYGTPRANNYVDTHSNINKSTILINLENWYKSNLADYEDKLADVIWCNDKSIVTDTSYSPLDESIYDTPTGLGYGQNFSYYKGFQRLKLVTTRDNELVEALSLSPATPVTDNDENWIGASLICPNDNSGGKLSKFTVKDTIYGNGNLDYKIGLLTADELAFSGMIMDSITNSSDFLYENAQGQYLTLTPGFLQNRGNGRVYVTNIFYVPVGAVLGLTLGPAEPDIRPAIALNKETTISSGTGTSEDPYIVN